MVEAIPRLAVAMQSVLIDAQIQVIGHHKIEIRFDGLPSWQIAVQSHLMNSQFQMIETLIDLKPLCIASMSRLELQRLAATENLGLRGVTILPVYPASSDERAGLRIRAAFMGQKGRTNDEIENLAIDIMTVLSFARTLEDRMTDNAIAGEFSFELYNTRFESPMLAQPVRFITTGRHVFSGSQDRVFSEIMKTLKNDLAFNVREIETRTSLVQTPDSKLEIVVKIPNEIPIFVAHAPLMKLDDMTPQEIWELLDELNSQGEAGHFEVNPADMVLSFTTWKHLTNDLRHFSFDHTIFSVSRAFALAAESIDAAPVRAVGGKTASQSAQVIDFPIKHQAPKRAA